MKKADPLHLTSVQADPPEEPELVSTEGKWTITQSLDRSGWTVGADYAFDVVGTRDNRRLLKDVGWIENPERFALTKVE